MRVMLFLFYCVVASVAWAELDDAKRIEAYLNKITTFRSPFTQLSGNGIVSKGVFYLSRPGKLRWEYQSPDPIVLLVKGQGLTYIDVALDEITHVPLEDTLSKLLTQKKIRFGEGLKVVKQEKKEQQLAITLQDPQSTQKVDVTLIFQANPLQLQGMEMTDALGMHQQINFTHPAQGLYLDEEIFKTPERKARGKKR